MKTRRVTGAQRLFPDSLSECPTDTVRTRVRVVCRYTGTESEFFFWVPNGNLRVVVRPTRRDKGTGPGYHRDTGVGPLYGGPVGSSVFDTLIQDPDSSSGHPKGVVYTRVCLGRRHTGECFGLFVEIPGGDYPYGRRSTRRNTDAGYDLFVGVLDGVVYTGVRPVRWYTGTRTGVIVGTPGLGSFGLGFNRLGYTCTHGGWTLYGPLG